MIYKLLRTTEDDVKIFARIDDDGKCRLTCSQNDANFKKEILADEAQLQDADGNTMTPEQAKTYVATLP
jgi:hypothetical protein